MASKKEMQDERATIDRELYTHAGNTSRARLEELIKRRAELESKIKKTK